MNPSPAAAPPLGTLRLDDWGVIRAAGPEAAKFLQGQLTQDVETLRPDEARLAGYCSAKGRLLASFIVWRRGPEELLLACSADLLAATLKRLNMFVLRAKCKLSDASAELPLWGLAGPQALGAEAPTAPWQRGMVGDADLIRLPDAVHQGVATPRWLWAGSAPDAALAPLSADAWRWLEVHSGVARITAATSEKFVPQMVNLELVGGVSFQKGCYPGQEIVARSQYRGTLKRRAYILEGDSPLQPGDEIFHSADPDQPAGLVALAGAHGGAWAALAELKIAALAEGTLHAGSKDGPPLRAGALPYALPTEAP